MATSATQEQVQVQEQVQEQVQAPAQDKIDFTSEVDQSFPPLGSEMVITQKGPENHDDDGDGKEEAFDATAELVKKLQSGIVQHNSYDEQQRKKYWEFQRTNPKLTNGIVEFDPKLQENGVTVYTAKNYVVFCGKKFLFTCSSNGAIIDIKKDPNTGDVLPAPIVKIHANEETGAQYTQKIIALPGSSLFMCLDKDSLGDLKPVYTVKGDVVELPMIYPANFKSTFAVIGAGSPRAFVSDLSETAQKKINEAKEKADGHVMIDRYTIDLFVDKNGRVVQKIRTSRGPNNVPVSSVEVDGKWVDATETKAKFGVEQTLYVRGMHPADPHKGHPQVVRSFFVNDGAQWNRMPRMCPDWFDRKNAAEAKKTQVKTQAKKEKAVKEIAQVAQTQAATRQFVSTAPTEQNNFQAQEAERAKAEAERAKVEAERAKAEAVAQMQFAEQARVQAVNQANQWKAMLVSQQTFQRPVQQFQQFQQPVQQFQPSIMVSGIPDDLDAQLERTEKFLKLLETQERIKQLTGGR